MLAADFTLRDAQFVVAAVYCPSVLVGADAAGEDVGHPLGQAFLGGQRLVGRNVNFACTVAQARVSDLELGLANAHLASLRAMPAYIAHMAAWVLGASDLLGRQHQQLLDEDFGRMQRKHLVTAFVTGLLLADPCDKVQQRLQLQQCLPRHIRHLSPNLADQHAKNRALAFDHAVQPAKLLGMGVATRPAPQRRALFIIGLLQCDAATLGQVHKLLAGHIKQTAIVGMSNGLFAYLKKVTP